MSLKTLQLGELLMVRGIRNEGLTPRGRVMRSTKMQEVRFKHPNKYYNIELEHISGPMKGTVILFSKVLCRKARTQSVCRCNAYNYPHATGKGLCQIKKS